ncbi:predicted protein [Arabidopsis lyrata subsp. lyrata]|uniref:Predicted protein n=1 Tax=Arabidopsis lyrata subsp. lyrata TaxID=81972 RepID=D7M439_ARALL|nr:predicted protein [Arabidopsis lyrata subsp. lyrata]
MFSGTFRASQQEADSDSSTQSGGSNHSIASPGEEADSESQGVGQMGSEPMQDSQIQIQPDVHVSIPSPWLQRSSISLGDGAHAVGGMDDCVEFLPDSIDAETKKLVSALILAGVP